MMQSKGRPLTHLPGRIAAHIGTPLEKFRTWFHMRLPHVLALPVRGPYVQLYRNDALFTTEISLFNYLSTFLPDIDQTIDYHVVAYDRSGRLIGKGRVHLAPRSAAQPNLQDVIGRTLDRYGMFHVLARPRSDHPEQTVLLGATSGQFMTLYVPRAIGLQAPQIVHSHKLLQRAPIFWSPLVRKPGIIEHIENLKGLQFYFINPNPLRLQARVTALDAANLHPAHEWKSTVPGFGVGMIDAGQKELELLPPKVCFEYEFDREVSHRKPLLFRVFPDETVTCNHT